MSQTPWTEWVGRTETRVDRVSATPVRAPAGVKAGRRGPRDPARGPGHFSFMPRA